MRRNEGFFNLARRDDEGLRLETFLRTRFWGDSLDGPASILNLWLSFSRGGSAGF